MMACAVSRISEQDLPGCFYFPVPVRFETCGLLTVLSLTCNVPVCAPVCVGEKITLILQLDFAARLVEQVVVETLKLPVVEIAMPVSAALCLLARVNVFAALFDPTLVAV